MSTICCSLLCFYLALLFFLEADISRDEVYFRYRTTRKGTVTKVQYYCCSNNILKEGTCEECPIGFTTYHEEAVCKPCFSNFFGYKCIQKCSCKENERCNHIAGCVRDDIDQRYTTEHTTPTTVFPNRQSIIYIGSVGLMAVIICSLIAYICFKKNGKKEPFHENKPNENPLVHWHNEHTNTDENEYAEIEDTVLYNIKATVMGVKVKDNATANNHKDSGLLHTYQPIISSEVDVHQYISTMKDEDRATTADNNQKDSGYLNPYQPLTLTTIKDKSVYNDLETRINKKYTEILKINTTDGVDNADCKTECT